MSSAALEAFVGQQLDGRYRLDKLLGAGGMGAVYRAHVLGSDPNADVSASEVAIKVLHPDVGSDDSISKRFDREAQSASKLDHPNCVRVTDFGTTAEGIKYLVMELLVGEELQARLGKPWAPAPACELLDQVLAGLEHAHQHGIVHRDLKPENVFLTRDGHGGADRAKIVDFGIAKLLDADGAAEVLTRAGMVFGTPRYMSPEQAAGGKIDARSDLYSVGILAYAMLAGQVPFESDDLAAVLRMHIMAPPPPLPSSVPAPLAAWVESLLEKSRHERPESAAVARESLAKVRAQIGAVSPSSPQPGVPTPITNPTDLTDTQPELAQAGIDQLGSTGAHTGVSAAVGALPSKPEAMVGHTVAERFVLHALIGVGGMGAVFRAEDKQTGTPVAVKLLHSALADDDEIAARFVREAETASELEHPNIVPVFSHGTTPGVGGVAHYLVMPLLEGVELRDLIAGPPGGPLDPQRAVALTLQLLDALAFAHERQVVHRDLKPENVFVIRDANGHEQVQLVDFGLAKVAEAGRSFKVLTQFGQVFGTAAYMSPEQCRGEVVDARTDIYAVGIILYELLAGRPPFEAESPIVLLGMQVFDQPPPLPEHVPAPLRQVVMSMLVKARDERMPSASAAIGALQAALAQPHAPAQMSAPTLAPVMVASPAASASMQGRPQFAIPRKWMMIGGGVIGLLVLIALWPSGSSEPTTASTDEPEPAAVKQEPSAPAGDGSIVGVVANAAGPDASVYAELDKLIVAKDGAVALDQVRKARDEFPGDGGLMWREAQALVLVGGQTNRVTALHRYAEAASADAALSKITEFEAQLRTLLRDAKLRDTAFDIAVRELGPLGHSFLLERLNDVNGELGYVDRHRALDELGKDPAMLARVDHVRQRALDLSQAHTAPNACEAFDDALDQIAMQGTAEDLPALDDRKLEIPATPGVTDEPEACDELASKRATVRALLAEKYPEAAAKSAKSSKKSGKKKKLFPF